MKIGDLVKVKTISKIGYPKIGFVVDMKPQNSGVWIAKVQFPKSGSDRWYDLSKVEVISEAG
jgi:hypothetical protein